MAGATASPSVRQLAGNLGVNLDALAARLGRMVTREDVLAESGTAPAQTAPAGPLALWDVDHAQWGPVRSEPLSKFARLSAANLSAASLAIPSVTHHDSADATRIEATRAALRASGRKVNQLAFHVAVLSRCLREFPRFNASLTADGAALIMKDFVHIAIAVDTPHGLMVPVIRDTDGLTVGQIGDAITDLATRAQARKVRPNEMGGASMTISNLGGIGGEGFTPIVNPPEVAILGITRTEMRPVWDGSAFQPRPMVPLSLTYDHRVVNGAEAARFIARYAQLFADPDDLLLT